MFYNVENLFDTVDDSLKNDNEFLPESSKKWTQYRYKQKLENIYTVIAQVGGWEPPAIIGLCEVENRYCLEGLVLHTNLSKYGYEIVHHESADSRGIDVALLYNPEVITVEHHEIIRPKLSKTIFTRDILYVKCNSKKETFHVYVNHWPSRRGGQTKSNWKRVAVAELLQDHLDSVLKEDSNAKVMIMGDFNDELTNESLQLLQTIGEGKVIRSLPTCENSSSGSLQYRGQWYVYDHILVSQSLSSSVLSGCQTILNAPYLLTEDKRSLDMKPFRTYAGPHYLGGFSDHLPVFIQVNTQR